MQHFYRDVPKLGNVAVTRHAQARCLIENITEDQFKKVLLEPLQPDIPDGQDVVWRERDGIRLVVIIRPVPDRGAVVVKTAFRIKPQAKAV